MAASTAIAIREELDQQIDAPCERHATFLQRFSNSYTPSKVIVQNYDKTFIFTLNNPHNLPPTTYETRRQTDDENEVFVVHHQETFDPVFGYSESDGASDTVCRDDHNYIGFPQSYIDVTILGEATLTVKSELQIGETKLYD